MFTEATADKNVRPTADPPARPPSEQIGKAEPGRQGPGSTVSPKGGGASSSLQTTPARHIKNAGPDPALQPPGKTVYPRAIDGRRLTDETPCPHPRGARPDRLRGRGPCRRRLRRLGPERSNRGDAAPTAAASAGHLTRGARHRAPAAKRPPNCPGRTGLPAPVLMRAHFPRVRQTRPRPSLPPNRPAATRPAHPDETTNAASHRRGEPARA